MLNTEICHSVNLGGFTLANITKRGNTFRIRVFVGCDMNGKQLVKSTTYTPPDGGRSIQTEHFSVKNIRA